MKKKELKKIIRESIKQLINEEKATWYKGLCYCKTSHGYSVIIKDCTKETCAACCNLEEILDPDKIGSDSNGMPFNTKTKKYIKNNQSLEENEGVNNTCRNKGFCCQERYSRKNTAATFQDGGCVCPQGSIQTNCPRK